MSAAITVGDAIKARLSQPDSWGDLFDDEEHADKVDTYAELSWTLNQFLRSERNDQKRILGDYIGDTFTDQEVEKWVSDLRGLLDTSKPKKAGDKWASPGRVVCSWPELDPTARLVMFVMAAHARDDGTNIWCSQETIAEILGFNSGEPVRRAWRRLEKVGAITKTELERPHRSARWRINKGPNPL